MVDVNRMCPPTLSEAIPRYCVRPCATAPYTRIQVGTGDIIGMAGIAIAGSIHDAVHMALSHRPLTVSVVAMAAGAGGITDIHPTVRPARLKISVTGYLMALTAICLRAACIVYIACVGPARGHACTRVYRLQRTT